MMGGIAGGVECLHIPEDPMCLESLGADLRRIKASFRAGKRKVFLFLFLFLLLFLFFSYFLFFFLTSYLILGRYARSRKP